MRLFPGGCAVIQEGSATHSPFAHPLNGLMVRGAQGLRK